MSAAAAENADVACSVVIRPASREPSKTAAQQAGAAGAASEELISALALAPPPPPRAAPAARAAAPRLQAACLSRAGCEPGFRKTNQDSCFAYAPYPADGAALFGVMDGHGPLGHHVSAFVKSQLPLALADLLAAAGAGAARGSGSRGGSGGGGGGAGSSSGGGAAAADEANAANPPPPLASAIARALPAAFEAVDARLAAPEGAPGSAGVNCEFNGSTCAVAHLDGARLTVAWVGDSRVVLGRAPAGAAASGSGRLEAVELTADHKPTNPGERERILASEGRVAR